MTRRGVFFEGVTRRAKRGARPVLRDLNLAFEVGQSTAILSKQSIASRAVINLISGATRPTLGRVTRTCSVSFPVAYAQGLSRHVSGLQNTTFLARIYGADIAATVDFVQEFSGLGDVLNNQMASYTPEQRTQFLLSLSYAMPFDMYVSSGTLIGGPPEFREKCKRHVQALRSRAGLIVTTKTPQIAKLFCDRAIVLHDGGATDFADVSAALSFFAAIKEAPPASSNEGDGPDAPDAGEVVDEYYEGF
jgi:capsular polysaccharide transport system ATP-binding protein